MTPYGQLRPDLPSPVKGDLIICDMWGRGDLPKKMIGTILTVHKN